MDMSKKITEKLKSFVSDSFSGISSFISSNDIDKSLIQKNHLTNDSFDRSFEMKNSETVILSKKEYSKLKDEISLLEESLNSSTKQNEEYKKLLLDYDTTMSLILEKEENSNVELLSNRLEEKEQNISCLENKLEQYEILEMKMKNHIEAIQKDLKKSLERAEMYKIICKEKIKAISDEKDELIKAERSKNYELCKRIDDLSRALEQRSAENVELVEYCKHFLNDSYNS